MVIAEKCKFYERFGAIEEECCYSCCHFVDDDPDRYPYCSVGCEKAYFPTNSDFDPFTVPSLFDCFTDDLPF